MSENEHLQSELDQDMAWLESAPELPEHLQAALGYMQMVISKVEAGEALCPDEMQLLAQAGTYAGMAG